MGCSFELEMEKKPYFLVQSLPLVVWALGSFTPLEPIFLMWKIKSVNVWIFPVIKLCEAFILIGGIF